MMDTPGLDVESVTGMVGGGAQVVVFTTGLGTPTGNPIAPVIKITGNARTARQMADNIDLDVSGIMDDTETLDAAADRLFAEVLAVCSGQADRGRAARPPRVRDSPAQPDDLSELHDADGDGHMLDTLRADRHAVRPRVATGSAAATAGSICALLFFAATINYIDRQVIGILKPTLQAEFGWSEIDYARHRLRVPARLCDRAAARRAGIIDRIGTKRGFALAIVVWSLAAMAHAEAPLFGPARRGVARRSSA